MYKYIFPVAQLNLFYILARKAIGDIEDLRK